jgi:hypothetical protein
MRSRGRADARSAMASVECESRGLNRSSHGLTRHADSESDQSYRVLLARRDRIQRVGYQPPRTLPFLPDPVPAGNPHLRIHL